MVKKRTALRNSSRSRIQIAPDNTSSRLATSLSNRAAARSSGKASKGTAGPVSDALIERLIRPYLDEARNAVRDGVVGDADLADAGLIFGTGFAPFRGGPLHYLGART